jgi:saccharopine dehydrogenase-like NADP-dependent oxidoreductase
MSIIVVLGCGIVGKYMAIDLCQNSNYKVIAVDVNREVLEELAREHPIQIRVEDLSTEEGVLRAIADADIVIGSVPYTVGNTMLERIIQAGSGLWCCTGYGQYHSQ